MNSKGELLDSGAEKPKRKVSVVPWLVMLVVGVCLFVMNTRGIADPDSKEMSWVAATGRPAATSCYDHGWPWTWHRSLDQPSGYVLADRAATMLGIPASEEERTVWPTAIAIEKIQWKSLLGNVLVATLILAILFLVFWLRRKRQKQFRFSLLELGICILIASFAFANYQHHRSHAKRERKMKMSSTEDQALGSRWCGPKWLKHLVGEHEWMSDYRHVDSFKFNAFVDDNVDNLSELVDCYKFARKIEITGDPSPSQIELLVKLQQLERIEVRGLSVLTFSRQGFGFYDDVQNIVRRRREREIEDTGEPYVNRIQKAFSRLPSVVELKIDSTLDQNNHWPRALDLVDCCPNLKKLSLHGKQYLIEDLANLPPSIEDVEYGFHVFGDEIKHLREQHSNVAIRNSKTKTMQRTALDQAAWAIAENRVNRRRTKGWHGSKFMRGILDLSFTEVDQEFLETIQPIFPDVNVVTLGSFDCPETAVWLVQQCSNAMQIDTNGFCFEFEDAMKLPESVKKLEIDHGNITAEEFIILIQHLSLRKITIKSSSLSDREVETIRLATPSCDLRVEP